MPVIYRPDTDARRLKALEVAKLRSDTIAPGSLSFSAGTVARINAFLPGFKAEVLQRGAALSTQVSATTVSERAMFKLAKFISHFLQVFNLGIDREVYTANERAHFQLDANQESLPDLLTEQDVMLWGQRIVDGDASRVAAGGAAMVNPSAAEVQTHLTAFMAAQADQGVKKDAYDKEQEDVAALRPEADDIIADIWDESEFTHRKETPASKRRKCREDGVVYRLRDNNETPSPDDFSIIGTVVAGGAATTPAIDGAQVTVVETNTTVYTNANGQYAVPVHPNGSYTIQVEKPGFKTQIFNNVQVVDGQITTLNIQLMPMGPPPPPGP